MTGYYLPDLSGTLPDYKVDANIITIPRTDIRIDFQSTVFAESLVIKVVGNPTDVFVEDVDYRVEAVDEDTLSLSKVMNVDPTFDKPLIKSIRFIRPIIAPLKVQMTYQQLYPVTNKSAVFNNDLIELSPELLLNHEARLASLEALTLQVPDTISDNNTTPTFLPYDINKEESGNVVTNERHVVNVFAGKNLIRPAQGSFFKDSVTLTIPDQGYTCIWGEDYVFAQCNHAKTKVSTNTGGIYEFIHFTRPFAGTVAVQYHAVGGEVTQNDAKALSRDIQNIKRFLESTPFVTTAGIGQTVVVQDIMNRLTALEENMRVLVSGAPSYGDATGSTGVGFAKRLRANDTNFHWWTLARLRTVEGSTDIILRETMKLRVSMVSAKLQADINIAADLTNEVNLSPQDKLKVESFGVLQNVGFTAFGTTTDYSVLTMPKFRIIWNQTVGNDSGIILQIGMRLPGLTETLGVSDISGVEGCWLLDQTTGTSGSPLLPNDDTILLPDSASVWSTTTPSISKSVEAMMPNKTGYLLWNGSKNLTDLDSDLGSWSIPHILPSYFNIADIAKVRIEMKDGSNNVQSVVVPVSGVGDLSRVGRAACVINDAAIPLYLTLSQDATTKAITATLKSSATASAISTTFAIQYIIVHFA